RRRLGGPTRFVATGRLGEVVGEPDHHAEVGLAAKPLEEDLPGREAFDGHPALRSGPPPARDRVESVNRFDVVNQILEAVWFIHAVSPCEEWRTFCAASAVRGVTLPRKSLGLQVGAPGWGSRLGRLRRSSVVLELVIFHALALDPQKGLLAGGDRSELLLVGSTRAESPDLRLAILDTPAQLAHGQIALEDAGK